MSPFFRGSVRPPRKHPKPWSLNPRLNPDIAKETAAAGAPDGVNGTTRRPIVPRASIYGLGANKEAITLPVHNGVYVYDDSSRRSADGEEDEEDEAGVQGVQAPGQVVAVVDAEEALGSEGKEAAETTGSQAAVIPGKEEVVENEWPLVSEAVDRKAVPDGQSEAVEVTTPEAAAPAPSSSPSGGDPPEENEAQATTAGLVERPAAAAPAPVEEESAAVPRTLTPPPEAHKAQDEDDKKSAAGEAAPPFVGSADHRQHTPPASRKPSRGEDEAVAVNDVIAGELRPEVKV